MAAADPHASIVPLEVVGWLIRRCPTAADVPRCLVVSADETGSLPAALVSRGPTFPFGVTLGFTGAHSADGVDKITQVAHEGVVPTVRTMDSLVPINWAHGAPWGRLWWSCMRWRAAACDITTLRLLGG